MESKTHKVVVTGLFNVMRPLARVLLAAGVSYREFAEIAKKAFVSVASSDHGLRGRPTNISRVAVMTGLTRKEVKRLRDNLNASNLHLPLMRSPANLVLSAWYSDSRFLDAVGAPSPLPESGDELSFVDLAKAYGGDVPPVALLKELERGGAVAIVNGMVKPLSRFFEPRAVDEEYLSSSFFSISNLLSTIVHNSTCERVTDRFPERYVFSSNLDETRFLQFKEMVEDSSMQYLTSLDDWLVGHESDGPAVGENSSSEVSKKIGVGLYFFKTSED